MQDIPDERAPSEARRRGAGDLVLADRVLLAEKQGQWIWWGNMSVCFRAFACDPNELDDVAVYLKRNNGGYS